MFASGASEQTSWMAGHLDAAGVLLRLGFLPPGFLGLQVYVACLYLLALRHEVL
jgi:hypothetical protein